MGVCVLYVLIWHLMGSAGCRAARLKSQSAKLAARYRIGTIICSPPTGVAPLGSSVRPPVRLSGARLGRRELGAVSQHGMHDDGEAPRQRDPRLTRGGSFSDRQCPVFELQLPLVACEHDIRGLVEKCPHPPITALRDAAGVVDLT